MNIESTLRADRIWRNVIRGADLFLLIITAAIGIFLLYRVPVPSLSTGTVFQNSYSQPSGSPPTRLTAAATLEPAFILSALLLPVLSP